MKTNNKEKFDAIRRKICCSRRRHPKFAEALTHKKRSSVVTDLAVFRIFEEGRPSCADKIIEKNLAESLLSYLNGDRRGCLDSLSRTAASVIMAMELVENEMQEDK